MRKKTERREGYQTRFSIICTKEQSAEIWKQIHTARLKTGVNMPASDFFLCRLGIIEWPSTMQKGNKNDAKNRS